MGSVKISGLTCRVNAGSRRGPGPRRPGRHGGAGRDAVSLTLRHGQPVPGQPVPRPPSWSTAWTPQDHL